MEFSKFSLKAQKRFFDEMNRLNLWPEVNSKLENLTSVAEFLSPYLEMVVTGFLRELSADAEVLELGVGSGAAADSLLKLNTKITYTGVDFSKPQRLQRLSGTYGKRFNFILADGTRLPLSEGCFDFVFTSEFFDDLPISVVKNDAGVLKAWIGTEESLIKWVPPSYKVQYEFRDGKLYANLGIEPSPLDTDNAGFTPLDELPPEEAEKLLNYIKRFNVDVAVGKRRILHTGMVEALECITKTIRKNGCMFIVDYLNSRPSQRRSAWDNLCYKWNTITLRRKRAHRPRLESENTKGLKSYGAEGRPQASLLQPVLQTPGISTWVRGQEFKNITSFVDTKIFIKVAEDNGLRPEKSGSLEDVFKENHNLHKIMVAKKEDTEDKRYLLVDLVAEMFGHEDFMIFRKTN